MKKNKNQKEEDKEIELGRKKNVGPSFNEKDNDGNNNDNDDDDDIFFSQLFVPIPTNKELMSATNQRWSQQLADFLIVTDDEEKLNTKKI